MDINWKNNQKKHHPRLGIFLMGFFVIAFFAMAETSQAATYYVDGNLSADCTSGNYSIANRACNGANGNAFNTITDINSRLQPGDTAIIRAGTYNQQIAPANNGTGENARITYARYQNETVYITPASGDGVELNGKSYITIDGLYLHNVKSYWVDLTSSQHCTVKNCDMINAGGYSGLRMNNAQYAVIQSNRLEAVAGSACSKTDASCPSDIVTAENTKYSLFEGNTFLRCSHGWGMGGYAEFNIVRNNIFDNPWHHSMGLYNITATNRNVVENNIIRNAGTENDTNPNPVSAAKPDDEHAGLQTGNGGSNTIVRNNIFYNNGRAFTIGAADRDSLNYKVYNNTFDQNLYGFHSQTWSYSYTITANVKNNSINRGSVTGQAIYVDDDNALLTQYWTSNNLYGQTGRYENITGNMAALVAAHPSTFISGNIGSNPLFVNQSLNNYNLTSTSPLIDAGTWLTTVTSPTGSDSTAPYTFTVADAGYFCDGWTIPGVTGDVIKLQNGQERTITAINYAINQITVNASVSWTKDMGVALDYEGARPDIGAKEYGGGGADTQAPGSPSGLTVR